MTVNQSTSYRFNLTILMILYVMIVISSFTTSAFTSIVSTKRGTHSLTFMNNNNNNVQRQIYNNHHSLFMATAMPDGPSNSNNDWENNERQMQNQKQQQQQQQQQSEGETSNFLPLESHPPSPQRLSRIEQEASTKSKFLHGDELIELRKYMTNLELDLQYAREKDDKNRIKDLTQALHESRNLDAEYVYLYSMEMADAAGSEEEVNEWKKEALEARQCLPQFNLQGLWVGKYGDHGYEMVNITYVGDTLVATKVTGDKNVPKGEITFTADLHPNAKGRDKLTPIELSDVASKQWGHKHLPRFPGQGQVASEGFTNNQWMDGQLILVGEYFSFAWIPLGHQIFFGRPSAELTLKMLKQSKMAEFGAVDSGNANSFAEMRAFAQRCFEETEILLDDNEEGELCFLMDDENYFCQAGVFE